METPATPAGGPRRSIATRRRVRVVGKVMRSTVKEAETESSASSAKGIRVSVLKPEGEGPKHATVVFKGPDGVVGDFYKLDWCYEQGESVDKLFLEEVKPMIQGIFQGVDASIIAFGAKGSGKSVLIEGSEDKPGLGPLAASEILMMCMNGSKSVKISCYEIYQDRVFDMFGKKEQEVQVLEDASGKIHLRGLSQIHVKSLEDFNQLYFHDRKPRIAFQKTANELLMKSHVGLILYVKEEESQAPTVGRINFVDLAGYEDTTHKNSAKLIEITRTNKSLHALHNVVFALNSNERHIPYRGCKLTHVLKDSINRDRSQTLIITCLKPSFSQETIRAVGMASNSCMATSLLQNDSSKKTKSIPKPAPPISPSASWSHMFNTSSKMHETSRYALLDRKLDVASSTIKGRKLFNVGSPLIKSSAKQKPKDRSSSCMSLQARNLNLDKENSKEASENFSSAKDESSSCDTVPERNFDQDKENSKEASEKFSSGKDESSSCGTLAERNFDLDKENHKEASEIFSLVKVHPEKDGESSEKILRVSGEETSATIDGAQDASPPISERLREIANSLKLLGCQPVDTVNPHNDIISCIGEDAWEPTEPKTPGSNFHHSMFGDGGISSTPQDLLRARSNGIKRCLVQELLTYINNATKEELMQLKGIGVKRADLIIELREESPQSFKDINDLRDIGLSSKQVKEMMKCILGDYYS